VSGQPKEWVLLEKETDKSGVRSYEGGGKTGQDTTQIARVLAKGDPWYWALLKSNVRQARGGGEVSNLRSRGVETLPRGSYTGRAATLKLTRETGVK